MKQFLQIILLLVGIALGAIAGHFEGEAMVYERVVGATAGMIPLGALPELIKANKKGGE